MKNIYLTFDIENIVTGLGYNPNNVVGMYLGAMYIANILKKNNLKGTFFISMSPKLKEVTYASHVLLLDWLIDSLKNYSNIKLAPHMHVHELPMDFDCKSDLWSDYSFEEQVELLSYAKDFFFKRGIIVDTFRPGGFFSNSDYYHALSMAGYKYSSTLNADMNVSIDMILNQVSSKIPYETKYSISEYPADSVRVKSIKGDIEVLNLSPDFFTIESMDQYFQSMDCLNVNFHSFSVFINRPIRENHRLQLMKNINFIVFERLMIKLLRNLNFEVIDGGTSPRLEFEKWIKYFVDKGYESYFIGE